VAEERGGEGKMTVKCAVCGKFIPYSDLDEREEGSRANFYFEPLSEYGPEVMEWICASCAAPDRLRDVVASVSGKGRGSK
jgi:hypothetical protein